ncbi:MAG: resolvase [Firmicutes bacterium]|nr:resolvase [Bacillota bacterium]
MILAVDPGSHKCGLAVVDRRGAILEKMVVPTVELLNTVCVIINKHPVSVLVVGDRTNGKIIGEKLKTFGLPVEMIDESGSSLEGRRRYLKEHSRGLMRLIPIGLRFPKEAYDDYVAVILAERFLKKISRS